MRTMIISYVRAYAYACRFMLIIVVLLHTFHVFNKQFARHLSLERSAMHKLY